MPRMRYISEYRINKKGAECFRTDSYEEAKARLERLRAEKPNVKYDMQSRTVRLDRQGRIILDPFGRPDWSPWG